MDEVDDVAIYQEAKVRARRTATFRLHAQEQRLTAKARRDHLDDRELAQLAAVRAELRARATGGRGWPFRLGEHRFARPA